MLDLERPEHAYLLGFLLGDGSLYSGRGRKGRLSIEVAERDAELLDLLAPLLPGALRSTRTRSTNFSAVSRTAVLSWCRYDVRQAVSEAGMPSGRKDTLIQPPAVPFSERDFARGLFDADGSIGMTGKHVPYMSLVTKSSRMGLWWCGVLLSVTGARRACRPNTRDSVVNVMVQTDAAATLARWLYREGDLALPRKQRAAAEVAAWRRPEAMRAASRPRRWTEEEDRMILGASSVQPVADLLERTASSVVMRRWRLRSAAPKG